ncbi:hypothetical protein [Microbacterium indicum]|uniref:hypothetical protein n=1 Tax=Microbacterium indicum TaxID=358100 RepID=UPI0003FCF45C|nr:hypothetical protein [Microbacterium indicum]
MTQLLAGRPAAFLLTFAAATLAVGCANEPASTDDANTLEGTYTVIESADDERTAELCEDGVAESLPPSCMGGAITNWDWSAVEHEEASGVRWGTYDLRFGRVDGGAIEVDAASIEMSTP